MTQHKQDTVRGISLNVRENKGPTRGTSEKPYRAIFDKLHLLLTRVKGRYIPLGRPPPCEWQTAHKHILLTTLIVIIRYTTILIEQCTWLLLFQF